MDEHGQQVLASPHEAGCSYTDSHSGLLLAGAPYQGDLRIRNTLSALVGGVQQLVGHFASRLTTEYAAVAGIDVGIVAASSQLLTSVVFVQPFPPQAVGLGIEAYRLACPTDTTAGAGHYLDQIEFGLTLLYLAGETLGIGDALNHRNANFRASYLKGSGLYAGLAAQRL